MIICIYILKYRRNEILFLFFFLMMKKEEERIQNLEETTIKNGGLYCLIVTYMSGREVF